MSFTGRRLEFCLACGGKLPEGSRIDRKYCRAACIERAYYRRHPDRKRVPGSHRAHNDSQHALTRPAATESTLRPAEPLPFPDSSPALARTSAPQQIEQLKQQLQAAADREQRLQEELAALRAQHRRDSMAQAAALDMALRQHATQAEQARGVPKQNAEAQQALRLNPRLHPPSSAKLQAGNMSRPALLWEQPARQPGSAPEPKWQSWSPSELEKIRRTAERILPTIPRQMRAAGSKEDAKSMSGYIGTTRYAPMFRKLSFLLILRIGCTAESHRQTMPQKQALARAALEDAVDALTQQGYPDASVLRKELDEPSPHFFRLALELVTACQGWSL